MWKALEVLQLFCSKFSCHVLDHRECYVRDKKFFGYHSNLMYSLLFFKGILINYLYLTQKYLFEIGLLKKFHFQAKHVCSLWLAHYQRKINAVVIFGIKFLLAFSLVLYNSKCLFPMVFCLYIVYTLGFFPKITSEAH